MTSSNDTVPPSAAPSTPPSRSRRARGSKTAASSRSRRARKAKARAWRPTLHQQRFIDTAVEFACRGKRIVLKDIAIACGIEETRPSKWRRDPRFCDAMTNTIAAEHKHLSVAARTSMYQLAVSGNFMAWDRVRDLERDLERLANPTPDHDGATFGGGTHVHIHAIPERQPMSALPPLLTLPAQSVQTVTTAPAK